jgi:hypothetical protein
MLLVRIRKSEEMLMSRDHDLCDLPSGKPYIAVTQIGDEASGLPLNDIEHNGIVLVYCTKGGEFVVSLEIASVLGDSAWHRHFQCEHDAVIVGDMLVRWPSMTLIEDLMKKGLPPRKESR